MNKKDNQDVLKAILNVKRYAKNLKVANVHIKKNAITMQQIQTDQHYQITSTPSLFPHNRQFMFDEVSSPVFHQGSSFRQSIPYKKRTFSAKEEKGTKDYSMSNIVHKKFFKPEDSFTKLKNPIKSRKQSSDESNEYLAQSMQAQSIRGTIKGYNPKNEEKKIKKQEKEKRLEMWDRIVDEKSQKEKVQLEEASFDVIKGLMKQIEYLNEQLTNYKKVMMVMKNEYLQMEQKVNEKIALEHYVDILKEQINSLQNQNEELKEIISIQNEKISQFQVTIANVSEQFASKYKEDFHSMSQTKIINEILIQLTHPLPISNKPIEKEVKIEPEPEPELTLGNVCKSDEQLKSKWKTNLPI